MPAVLYTRVLDAVEFGCVAAAKRKREGPNGEEFIIMKLSAHQTYQAEIDDSVFTFSEEYKNVPPSETEWADRRLLYNTKMHARALYLKNLFVESIGDVPFTWV
jgi:hypothetical protein